MLSQIDIGANGDSFKQLQIGPVEVDFQIVQEDDSATIVNVDDTDNPSLVEKAIQDNLKERFWFLSAEFKDLPITERFQVDLSEDTKVKIFNFHYARISEEDKFILIKTLAILYDSLKDKNLWRLDSIQIMPEDRPNGKNGELMRGMEVPWQRRFQLFPAAFAHGKYRKTMDCSWLEGTIFT